MSLEKCNTKTQRYEDTKSEDEISHQIIGASIEVHRTLGGPGLLESIYESAFNKWHLIDFFVPLCLRAFVFNSFEVWS